MLARPRPTSRRLDSLAKRPAHQKLLRAGGDLRHIEDLEDYPRNRRLERGGPTVSLDDLEAEVDGGR
jgi:hypothetical protein